MVRAFVQMREAVIANQRVAAKLAELESRIEHHDGEIQDLVDAIRELITPLPANNRRIGFEAPSNSTKPRGKTLRAKQV